MFNDHLEDIALFFKNSKGQQKRCWVTKDVYTDPERKMSVVDVWKGAIFSLGGDDAGSPYYVTNLSRLLKPGVSPDRARDQKAESSSKAMASTPTAGDLVVIPYGSQDAAYLIKQADYEDPDTCPEISKIEGADLAFLAITQGVLLANVPKEDITGMSCYLLNLLGLNSGA